MFMMYENALSLLFPVGAAGRDLRDDEIVRFLAILTDIYIVDPSTGADAL